MNDKKIITIIKIKIRKEQHAVYIVAISSLQYN